MEQLTGKQRYLRLIDENYLLRILRSQMFHAQNGRCFYCDTPMWEMTKGSHTRSHRHQISEPFRMLYDIKYPQAKMLVCTTEHLTGKKDNGSNHIDNVVAACQHCNSKRFNVDSDITPTAYKKYVDRQMKRGTWFTFPVHTLFEYNYTLTVWNRVMGNLIRYIRTYKPTVKKIRTRIRGKVPYEMTLMQCMYSHIRVSMS